MRRLIGILVCLWVATSLFAVTYQPCKPAAFRTTSAYVAPMQSASPTMSTNMQRPLASGSLSAISASNFEVLNCEGGACHIPSATPGIRKGSKVTEPETEAVGEGVWESPIGDTPWILFGLLLIAYGAFKWKKKSAEI